MIKGINYWAFPPGPNGAPIDPVDAMSRAKELGYDCFELTVDPTGPVSLETTQREAIRVREQAARIGISLRTAASGIAWGLSPTHPDSSVRESAVAAYGRIIQVASWLGAETLLYLPGMVSAVFVPDYPPQPYEEVDLRARRALRELIPTAERLGVRLAVENVWNRYLLSPVEMRDFIDSFGSPFVASYFDVGNCMLYGHPEDWIRVLGKRIAAVHLKDFRVNTGNLDGFVDLLSGNVDFPAVMKALAEAGYSGPCTAEIVPGTPGAVEKAAAAIGLIEGY